MFEWSPSILITLVVSPCRGSRSRGAVSQRPRPSVAGSIVTYTGARDSATRESVTHSSMNSGAFTVARSYTLPRSRLNSMETYGSGDALDFVFHGQGSSQGLASRSRLLLGDVDEEHGIFTVGSQVATVDLDKDIALHSPSVQATILKEGSHSDTFGVEVTEPSGGDDVGREFDERSRGLLTVRSSITSVNAASSIFEGSGGIGSSDGMQTQNMRRRRITPHIVRQSDDLDREQHAPSFPPKRKSGNGREMVLPPVQEVSDRIIFNDMSERVGHHVPIQVQNTTAATAM